MSQGCVFCDIAANRAPAKREYLLSESGQLIDYPGLVAFHNRLDWARVMLLVIPVKHMTQAELWKSDLLGQAALLSIALGEKLIPEGFRILSNFGRPAHQSQEHAHIHIVATPDNTLPSSFEANDQQLMNEVGDVRVDEIEIHGVTWSARVSLTEVETQIEMWRSDKLVDCGRVAIDLASLESPDGFRLVANFFSPATSIIGGGEPSLLILGGGELDLYA